MSKPVPAWTEINGERRPSSRGHSKDRENVSKAQALSRWRASFHGYGHGSRRACRLDDTDDRLVARTVQHLGSSRRTIEIVTQDYLDLTPLPRRCPPGIAKHPPKITSSGGRCGPSTKL